jgi:hypothetical protein
MMLRRRKHQKDGTTLQFSPRQQPDGSVPTNETENNHQVIDVPLFVYHRFEWPIALLLLLLLATGRILLARSQAICFRVVDGGACVVPPFDKQHTFTAGAKCELEALILCAAAPASNNNCTTRVPPAVALLQDTPAYSFETKTSACFWEAPLTIYPTRWPFEFVGHDMEKALGMTLGKAHAHTIHVLVHEVLWKIKEYYTSAFSHGGDNNTDGAIRMIQAVLLSLGDLLCEYSNADEFAAAVIIHGTRLDRDLLHVLAGQALTGVYSTDIQVRTDVLCFHTRAGAFPFLRRWAARNHIYDEFEAQIRFYSKKNQTSWNAVLPLVSQALDNVYDGANAEDGGPTPPADTTTTTTESCLWDHYDAGTLLTKTCQETLKNPWMLYWSTWRKSIFPHLSDFVRWVGVFALFVVHGKRLEGRCRKLLLRMMIDPPPEWEAQARKQGCADFERFKQLMKDVSQSEYMTRSMIQQKMAQKWKAYRRFFSRVFLPCFLWLLINLYMRGGRIGVWYLDATMYPLVFFLLTGRRECGQDLSKLEEFLAGRIIA